MPLKIGRKMALKNKAVGVSLALLLAGVDLTFLSSGFTTTSGTGFC